MNDVVGARRHTFSMSRAMKRAIAAVRFAGEIRREERAVAGHAGAVVWVIASLSVIAMAMVAPEARAHRDAVIAHGGRGVRLGRPVGPAPGLPPPARLAHPPLGHGGRGRHRGRHLAQRRGPLARVALLLLRRRLRRLLLQAAGGGRVLPGLRRRRRRRARRRRCRVGRRGDGHPGHRRARVRRARRRDRRGQALPVPGAPPGRASRRGAGRPAPGRDRGRLGRAG